VGTLEGTGRVGAMLGVCEGLWVGTGVFVGKSVCDREDLGLSSSVLSAVVVLAGLESSFGRMIAVGTTTRITMILTMAPAIKKRRALVAFGTISEPSVTGEAIMVCMNQSLLACAINFEILLFVIF